MSPAIQPIQDPSRNGTYQHPQHQCDLIMKGGVTSGVVYPPAILELAKEYRFRSVGGTSAGAIAAAAAAAAEHGREKDPESKVVGFAGLYRMMEELQREGFLFQLFQPAPETRPLFDAIINAMEVYKTSGRVRRGRQLLELLQKLLEDSGAPKPRKNLPLVTSRGSAALLAWPAISLARSAPRALKALAAGSSLWSLGKLVSGLIGAYRTLKGSFDYVLDKDRSFFALCTGMPGASPNGNKGIPALTPWLHERIQQLAGLPGNEILTIGKLRDKKLPDGARDESAQDVGIDFQMVTTNLSQRQPYTLHGEDLEEAKLKRPHPEEMETGYLFKESDMRRLFPREVVDYLTTWMERAEHQTQWATRDALSFKGFKLPKGYFPFPRGNALPVLVATRMSLSFPLLLSAVRLYTVKNDTLNNKRGTEEKPYELKVDQREEEDNDLRENWFSDGGIASNFPIHIFDSWLPSRPTFGINLADSQLPTTLTGPRESPVHRLGEDVFLPQPGQLLTPRVYPISSVPGFLGAIFDTAQNYRDNTQARMPSYRERVVHVRLQDDEGGLNLKMDSDTIAGIAKKGQEAAQALKTLNFNQHRWVRLLVLLSRLEHEFFRLQERYEKAAKNRKEPPQEGSTADGWKAEMHEQYRKLLALQAGNTWYRSQTDEKWPAEALKRMDALITLISSWTSTMEGQGEQRRATEGQQPAGEDHKYFFAYDEPVPEGILRVTPDN